MQKLKAILSQGHGRIQLGETSVFLKQSGINVRLITGWVPRKISPKLVNFLGKVVGRPNLYKRIIIRQPKELSNEEVISSSLPEFTFWFLILLSRFKFISEDNALTFGWLFLGWRSKKYIKDAEIFHVRSGAGQGGAIQIAKKLKMKIIVDHSIAHPVSMKNYLLKEYDKFNKKYDLDPSTKFWTLVQKDCEEADYIVVNSDFVKQTFLENGFENEKIKVIYFGVRKDFIGIKKDWRIKLGEPTKLLFIGNFGFRKGARVLIDAIKILNSRNLNVQLDILGIVDEMGRIDIPSNINFRGIFLYDELKNFLKTRDIYVFPTFAEGSSRAAMEAMASGIPVVTTYNCGVPITHNLNGIIVPIDDSTTLANEIERLMLNESLRQTIGLNASNLIRDSYTWEIYRKNIVEFYREIIAN
ncbi:glycosyltransferase [Pedobacter cryophilus]|uniref:Glycosyltransferase n=1 Tax=Pedobacter cryophilus TaxID=2571271 RepID=A0A4U1C9V9_9SPHI|nr:glycosyltransferase [Pedobacter cryophilus]TKC00458.1 glycosyltransferase [Pedobacter cryophilus]